MGISVLAGIPTGIDRASVVLGIDLSHWKPTSVDFHELYDAGIRFVITKATDWGSSGPISDPTYSVFRQKAYALAKEKGDFFFGGFAFVRPNVDVRKQADYFIRVASPKKGDILPALDVETTGINIGHDSSIMGTYLSQRLSCKRLLYTYEPFWVENLKDHWSGDFRLWLARYRSRKPDTPCDIWQFSDSEKLPSQDVSVDADVFFGSISDFKTKMLM